MIAPRVSVVIVSHGRAEFLSGAIRALLQQSYPCFEIVVVAEAASLARLDAAIASVKLVEFEEANVATARNLGIENSAGEIIAFIDDDARPEPTWISRLIGPIASGAALAATGRVLGRNGISDQSQCCIVSITGKEREYALGSSSSIFRNVPIKLVGTNCAFDAQFLRRIGGFDEGYPFYLDDTDVSIRAASVGAPMAYVGDAVVHHGFAEGPFRRQDRVPRSLFQIGRSSARFLALYCPARQRQRAMNDMIEAQRQRLLEHMIAGRLDPFQVRLLLKDFYLGLKGVVRADDQEKRTLKQAKLFRPVPVMRGSDRAFSSRLWRSRSVQAAAHRAVRDGDRVTVFRLSWTALYHTVQFQDVGGIWLQRGGLFGRSSRSDPLFRIWKFKARIMREMRRTSDVRFPSNIPNLESE